MDRNELRVIIIVQARMGSTRLPGKILKEVLDKPLLVYLFERLRAVSFANRFVIATTTNPNDDQIVNLCEKEGISVFRASEEDVLSRYYYAAKEYNADVVVRITSDCPLIDPQIVDQGIQYFLDHHSEIDYLSYSHQMHYPRGMDAEIFTFKSLEAAFLEAKEPSEREHVTLFLYRHPELFNIGALKSDKDYSHYRLTVDTPEDFELIKRILEKLYPTNPHFTFNEILQVLKENPEWPKINAHIKQKAV